MRLALPAAEDSKLLEIGSFMVANCASSLYDFRPRSTAFDPEVDLYPEKNNAPLYKNDFPRGSLRLSHVITNMYNQVRHQTFPNASPYIPIDFRMSNFHWA